MYIFTYILLYFTFQIIKQITDSRHRQNITYSKLNRCHHQVFLKHPKNVQRLFVWVCHTWANVPTTCTLPYLSTPHLYIHTPLQHWIYSTEIHSRLRLMFCFTLGMLDVFIFYTQFLGHFNNRVFSSSRMLKTPQHGATEHTLSFNKSY